MPEVGQIVSVTLDCPDPKRLGEFYQQATGWNVIYSDDDAVYMASESGIRLGVERAAQWTPPQWASNTQPHIRVDVAVTDLAEAEQRLLKLGASRPGHELDNENWIFMADPAGHPFSVTTVF